MAKILVTGGAGFVGSHLIDRLIARGDSVICVDNFFTGQSQNISHLKDHPKFELIRHDIVEPLRVEVDQIYNLACPASPVHYQHNPIKTIKTSTVGMVNMLGLAKRLPARILQASTSEVYGDPKVHPQTESYWGNVNPIGPRACYSDDTEALTKDGWKLLKDITKKDELMTLSKHHKLEYQNPTDTIKEAYAGELIKFHNQKIDLAVTPNHKMYVRPRGQTDFVSLAAYESINWSRAEMQKKAKWKGKETTKFYLPPVTNNKFGHVDSINMDDWLEFLGYYITEGCVHLRKRTRTVNEKKYQTTDYNVLIAQDRKNTTTRNKIGACLKQLPFTYFSSDDHQFRIVNKQLALYLKQFGKAHEKYLPQDIKNLSARQLTILFEAMMAGDGSKTKDTYYSNSTKLIGDFQEILLKIGMSGTVTFKDTRKNRPVYHMGIQTDQHKDFLTPRYPKREIEKYKGFVYCVTVPNHIVYVRRNGKAVFCGNCYDEGKRVAETLCFDYHRQNQVDIRVARIFNTYGPRMHPDDGRVVSNFIMQALHNKAITLYGDGSQTRSFCYVDDLVTGLLALMDQTNTTGPINIGNPVETSMKELAEIVIDLTNSSSKLTHQPLPIDDPQRRQPDISLAKQHLNWQPKVSLTDGLGQTIDYFNKQSGPDSNSSTSSL